jgi:hypothetical protein
MTRLLVPLLVCLAALIPQSFQAGEKTMPADLAFVPGDAVGFIHVRLADVWKSDFSREWRETVLKAGEKYLAAFDKRFFPTPSSLDRLTIFLASSTKHRPPKAPLTIVATSKAIDKEKFLEFTMPGASEEKTPPEGTILVDAKKKTAVRFLDDKTFVVAPVDALRDFLSRPRATKGNLRAALELARSGKSVVMALNPQALPERELRDVPGPFQPLLKAKLATLTLSLKKESRVDVHLAYADADQAGEAETAAQEAIKLARTFIAKGRKELEAKVLGRGQPGSLEELPEAAASLFGLGMLKRAEEFLDSSPITKEGDSLHVSVKLPHEGAAVFTVAAMGTALLVPAVQKVREAAARTQSTNNLKQMVLAMHNYHGQYRMFPPAAICDKIGKPLLSWRVAILPYIEQDQLYRRFKLDEPWDSEHNMKLIPLMPPTYALPAAPSKPGDGKTHYRVFVGGGAGFEWCKGLRIAEYRDGTSNTIAIVEAAQSVPWTKPDELVYDVKKPLPKMGNFDGNGVFNAALFDGSVRAFRTDVREATLRAYITRAGNEVIPNDE